MSKMTDEQIINSIKEYVDWAYDTNIAKLTYDEINDFYDLVMRQQAEIEKLNVELVGMRGACNSYKMHYDKAKAEIERLTINMNAFGLGMKREKERADTIKAEAIKEFAEKVKGEAFKHYFGGFAYEIKETDIDNLVKEMVGEENDTKHLLVSGKR